MTSRIRSRSGAAAATVALVTAAVALATAGCSGSVSSGMAHISPSPSAAPTSSISETHPQSSGAPGLIVLGDGFGANGGLWSFQAPDRWVALQPAGEFTAVGRDPKGIVLANRDSTEVRSSAALTAPGKVIQLKWPGSSPRTPVAAVDRSPAGTLALALSDGTGSSFAIVSPDGTVTIPRAAPGQSFSPLVAWIDDARLLVLSTDEQQVSRIAVLDVTKDSLTTLKAVGGVYSFALSGDRKTLVAATGSTLYVEPVADWLGSAPPKKIVDLAADQIVWDLAMDQPGNTVAMLSGTEAADGTVSAAVELEYAARGSTWTQILSSSVPFKAAKGQVWIADPSGS